MKKKTTYRKLMAISAIVFFVLAAGSFTPFIPAFPIIPPANAKATCVVPAAEFNSWFVSGAVALNGEVKPANSITFPNIPNCSFYKWTEQMFLWLTSPTPVKNGGVGGPIFDSEKFFDVSPPDASQRRVFIPHKSGQLKFFNLRAAQVGRQRLPVIMERGTGRMMEIAPTPLSRSGKQLIMNAAGKEEEIENIRFDQANRPLFLNKAGAIIEKPTPILGKQLNRETTLQKFQIGPTTVLLNLVGVVINVEQGQANGSQVLMAQNGSLIYYTSIVNEVYAYFRTSFGNGAIPSATKFPTTQAELNSIISFATAHSRTITNPEALAIEIKTSWIETAGLAEPEKFLKIKGTIPTYNKSNPNNWVINGQKTVELAMVGMHIVGSTAGHPEMLWGTFEHINNTPDAAYSYTNTANALTNIPQNTAGAWLFCANNAAGSFNQAHMTSTETGIASADGFTISPSNTIRWKAWGKGEVNTSSNTEIISINNSVRNQLINGDVRKNYIQTGTTWTIFGKIPDEKNQVGTNKLTNTTMETYQQGASNSSSVGTNCFTCHGTNTTEVSHLFAPLKPLF